MNINMVLIGSTLEMIGVLLIALLALRVHWRVRLEHKIDNNVYKAMGREHALARLGILFIVLGYILQNWSAIIALFN